MRYLHFAITLLALVLGYLLLPPHARAGGYGNSQQIIQREVAPNPGACTQSITGQSSCYQAPQQIIQSEVYQQPIVQREVIQSYVPVQRVVQQVYAQPIVQQQVYAQPILQQQVYAQPIVRQQIVQHSYAQPIVSQNIVGYGNVGALRQRGLGLRLPVLGGRSKTVTKSRVVTKTR